MATLLSKPLVHFWVAGRLPSPPGRARDQTGTIELPPLVSAVPSDREGELPIFLCLHLQGGSYL